MEEDFEQFIVTGLVKAAPKNSSIRFDMLIPFEKQLPLNAEETEAEFETFNMHLAAEDQSRGIKHKVRRGDTLGSLARRYHVSIAKLKQWNGPLKIIRIGQVIRVRPDEQIQRSLAQKT